jgi:hypothetical protein
VNLLESGYGARFSVPREASSWRLVLLKTSKKLRARALGLAALSSGLQKGQPRRVSAGFAERVFQQLLNRAPHR